MGTEVLGNGNLAVTFKNGETIIMTQRGFDAMVADNTRSLKLIYCDEPTYGNEK